MKKISMKLSEKSIENAIKELNQYKKELKKKMNRLIDEMVKYGEDYAINQVGRIDTGKTAASIRGFRNGNKGVIIAGGNAVWIEFGTGVKNNTPAGSSPHPMGEDLGMTIGGYGKGQGANPDGWWYFDGEKVRHTRGIKANMFMWETAKELERIAPELAKEVFAW